MKRSLVSRTCKACGAIELVPPDAYRCPECKTKYPPQPKKKQRRSK